MLFRRIQVKLPGLAPFYVYIHHARRGCEHICLVGALTDFGAALMRVELFPLILFGKLAFAVGAMGVYLLHFEEAHPLHGPRLTSSETAKEG